MRISNLRSTSACHNHQFTAARLVITHDMMRTKVDLRPYVTHVSHSVRVTKPEALMEHSFSITFVSGLSYTHNKDTSGPEAFI